MDHAMSNRVKLVPVTELKIGDVRPGAGAIIGLRTSKSKKTTWITTELMGIPEQISSTCRVVIMTSPEVVPDYRTEAATTQGLDVMDERLTTERISHTVDDTGGATMMINVPLRDGTWIGVVRSGDWDGCEHDPNDWTLTRYDDANDDFEDLGFSLSMTDAITIISQASTEEK